MKRALLVRFSSLGDVVLTSVLFNPLISLGFKPYILTLKPYGELFLDDNRVKVIEIDKKLFLKEIKKIPKDFEIKVDLHKNLKSLLVRLHIKGKWRSYPKESLRRRLSILLKNLRKSYYIPEAYAKSIEDLIKVENPRPSIIVSEVRVKRFKEILGDYVVIAPGARYRKKRYPHFKELSALFFREGIKVVIVGDNADFEISRDFYGENLCGKLSLIDVLAVIKGARLFIGNDSGLLHCARAVKTKAIQIYGGTHPTLGFSLYPDEGYVFCKCLECQPCDLHGKGDCKFNTYECLDISPIKIFEKAISILNYY